MLEGLLSVLQPDVLLFVVIGVLGGILAGSLPGFTATMGTALLLPFTFALPPAQAFAMLAALYVSAMFADSVPACLVNTPGTPSAVATALDGFELTKQGRGQQALVASAFSAFVGTLIGGLVFLFSAGPLADVALRFGPAEFFWIGVFAVTIIGSIAGESLIKGVAGGVLGMLIAMIGISATGAVVRYTFGVPQLAGGVNVVAALIGIFAIPQVMHMVRGRRDNPTVASYQIRPRVVRETVGHIVRRPVNVLRSSVIGAFIGILPGAGSPVASPVAYNEAARWGRDRSRFGKGTVDGVVASESAGNAAAGGAMIPMAVLGIPGSPPTAVILGALLLQGLRPGPTLFASNPVLVYGFAWSVLLAGVVTYIVGSLLSRILARLVQVPVRLLAPIILFLSVVGSFAIRSQLTDVFLMLGLGLVVYLLSRIGFHPGPIGLGVILGPIIERAFAQSMAISDASSLFNVLFGSAISFALITLTVMSVAFVIWSRRRERRSSGPAEGSDERDG